MKKTVILAAFFLLFGAMTAVGAETTAGKLQKRYQEITSMRASFTQTLVHKESGGRESRSGVMTFQKPFLLRWEVVEPSPELLVVTDREIWNEFADEEIVYKYPLSMAEDAGGILRVITGQARMDEDFIIDRETREGNLIKLEAFPNEPSQSLTEARLWVDADSGLLHRVVIIDFFGNENDITFQDIKTDIKIAGSPFAYSPPKGMRVEDRTGEASGGRQQLLQ